MSAVATLLSLGLQLPPPPKVGLLCVGLAGNNGATLVASQLANRRGLTWEHHSAGPQRAFWELAAKQDCAPSPPRRLPKSGRRAKAFRSTPKVA